MFLIHACDQVNGKAFIISGERSKYSLGFQVQKLIQFLHLQIYFHVMTADHVHTAEFQRIVFKSDKFPDLVVVQYKGNADVAGPDLEPKKKGRPPGKDGSPCGDQNL